jgi:hypothetical protein
MARWAGSRVARYSMRRARVRGVIVAESPRRGRIYTTAPASVEAFLTRLNVSPENGPAEAFDEATTGRDPTMPGVCCKW